MTRTLLLSSLLLAACSSPPPPAPRQSPSPSPSPAGSIPAALQGRYGLTPAACNPGPGNVRGLLTIGGDAIAFGVSPLVVDRVALEPGRVLFDTSVTTEGMVESRRYAFRVSPDQRQLARVELGRPDQVYTRCANQPS